MHHTNLWSTKLFLSDWRFALYLHFPYMRFAVNAFSAPLLYIWVHGLYSCRLNEPAIDCESHLSPRSIRVHSSPSIAPALFRGGCIQDSRSPRDVRPQWVQGQQPARGEIHPLEADGLLFVRQQKCTNKKAKQHFHFTNLALYVQTRDIYPCIAPPACLSQVGVLSKRMSRSS